MTKDMQNEYKKMRRFNQGMRNSGLEFGDLEKRAHRSEYGANSVFFFQPSLLRENAS
jgi:hypothetical protein